MTKTKQIQRGPKPNKLKKKKKTKCGNIEPEKIYILLDTS